MVKVERFAKNPILTSKGQNGWESKAVFNGCTVFDKGIFKMLYRAISDYGISTIGITESLDGIHFKDRRQLIVGEQDFEKYGVEDPRITKLDDSYYIFYTALSTMPLTPSGIKIGLVKTRDFVKFEKHAVTPFNSKAMALFPKKIDGKIVGILTVNTDMPPSKIALVFFDNEEQIWSFDFWQNWLASYNKFVLNLARAPSDQVEVGAPPVLTDEGWLLIYAHIRNYYSANKIFGVEAVLLDLNDPLKIIARTNSPMMVPQQEYEKKGNVADVIFPSGALTKGKDLYIYYGAGDSSCCLATCKISDLLEELVASSNFMRFERFEGNPIIEPNPDNLWEAKATFNPAAFIENSKVHIIYRAMSFDNVSVFGLATSSDGLHIDERLNQPIYTPREDFEIGVHKGGNSGCEDPRITRIGDKFYICYTAFDGRSPPRVALTHISAPDFFQRNWQFAKPVLISPPGIDDKDACILPEKINGKYLIFHRIDSRIWIDYVDNLNFSGNQWILGNAYFDPRADSWDDGKIGICGVPIKTDEGWLMFYHGVSKRDNIYRLGAMLLELGDPRMVIVRTDYPILEPEMDYEKVGNMPNVVFPCGSVVIDRRLFIYYGGADRVTAVAWVNLDEFVESLLVSKKGS